MKEYRLDNLLHDRVVQMKHTIFFTDIAQSRELSYLSFEDEVIKAVNVMKTAGVKRKSKVIFMLKNGLDFAKFFYALSTVHAIVIPVNPKITYRELEYIIHDSNANYILSEKELSFSAQVKSVLLAEENLHVTPLANESTISEDEIVDHTMLIMYTSGSTGNAKGVMLTHQNLLSKMDDIATAHELTKEDAVLCVLPWFHINGLVITMLTPLLAGHRIVVPEKFSVSSFAAWVKKYQITWFSGVPTLYTYLLSSDTCKAEDFSSLRFARSASSALPVTVLHKFENMFKVPIIESYGITEGCSQITTNPISMPRKAGSVGIPYGNTIAIMDEDGNPLPMGEIGEVWVKGRNITKGYYHKPEETRSAFTGSWFHTGDLGYLDEDGYLYLKGRKKELINKGGEKFSPLEIDNVLYEIAEIDLACAVGVPDDIYGEEVVAFVKLKKCSHLDIADILDHCQKRLSRYKIPKEIFFADEFPQGGNGKVQRLKFRKVYQDMKGKK